MHGANYVGTFVNYFFALTCLPIIHQNVSDIRSAERMGQCIAVLVFTECVQKVKTSQGKLL